jgi:hypothetical protein
MAYGWLSVLPYGIIVAAMIIVGFLSILTRVPGPVATELAVAVGTIALVVMTAVVIVTTFCVQIRPIEEFVDAVVVETAETEGRICALIKKTDEFIKNEVGIAGIDNPRLVSAKRAELAAAAEPMLVCDAFADYECILKKKEAPIDDEERLSRMERTLMRFVYPEIRKACAAASCDRPCETLTLATADTVAGRLAAMNDVADGLDRQIDIIDEKTDSLRRGELSDCDREKGMDVGSKTV